MSIALRGLTKVRQIGVLRLGLAVAASVRNRLLHAIYRFDPWHMTGTYYARPYKAHAVALIDSLKPETVVEIGVGLGDIIGRVTCKRRVGIDLDAHVLKAAAWLLPGNIHLKTADFSQPQELVAALSAEGLDKIDALVLINWIHMIDFQQITQSIDAIRKVMPVRHIIIDAIKPGIAGYRHHHSAADIGTLGDIVRSIEADEVRTLHLVRVGVA